MMEVEPVSAREAFSGISGSVSLACWIFLLVPQLIENYRNGSADGLSLAFLVVWFVGDITNLLGAFWARLLPTLIALAVYFCFADVIMISQVLYYNHYKRRRASRRQAQPASSANAGADGGPPSYAAVAAAPPPENSETSPLLDSERDRRNSQRRRRSSAAYPQPHHRRDSLSAVLEEGGSKWKSLVRNSVSVFLVVGAGAAGWLIAYKTGAWRSTHEGDDLQHSEMPIGAEVLGYISSICYLCARLPQIYHNWAKKSCSGLSLLFFLLSVMGNTTYGASILLHNSSHDYVMLNLPWLIGSLGTIFEDFIIFLQFHIYATLPPERDSERGEAAQTAE